MRASSSKGHRSTTLFADPQHPYTMGLLGSIPRIEVDRERLSTIEGSVPSPNNPRKGCRFAPRCPFADPRAAMSSRRPCATLGARPSRRLLEDARRTGEGAA